MSSVRSPHALAADAAFGRLKERLIAATGLSYYADKDVDLCGHVTARLQHLQLPDCTSYLARLQGPEGDTELDALVERLTIGETFFFRHAELFSALRDVVLPECIRRNQHCRRLRIWSAGCSTGAEAYSVAILLGRELAPLVEGWDVSILGTDINRRFLARARTGQFEDWALRGMPDDLRRACFLPAAKVAGQAGHVATRGSRVDDSTHEPRVATTGRPWQIAPRFQQCVSFQYHNLVKHPFPSLLHNLLAFDVILCRNVMIYFGREILERLVGQFRECLAEGGWLLVGHAEPNVELFRQFRTVNTGGAVLYQASPAASSDPNTPPALDVRFESATMPASRPAEVLGSNSVAPRASEAPKSPTLPVPAAAHVSRKTPPGESAMQQEVCAIRSLADQGKLDEAVSRCEKLLATHRLDPAAHFYSALVLEQVGQHAAAEQALRRAIYLDRNYVLAHYYLGLLLQRLNDRERSARSFQNVLSIVASIPADRPIADADGLTARDLANLTRMQLGALNVV